MSGGSQHNPNGRQSQLGPAWSPLQVASFLSRAPQAHLSSERGVTWHTPTPPPHLYHVPVPSPPDPLQAMAMKGGAVYRHTATPPDIYRHTPTPPDKHLLRHTPSPGDMKTELYPHLGPGRVPDKPRAEDPSSRGALGVDLSVSRGGGGGGGGSPSAHAAPALSVRDAPTINSLIARAQPRAGHGANRVEALLERLAPAPVSPRSVIVAARALSASPPADPDEPATKRKRKPDRTVRMPAPPPPPVASPPPSSTSTARPLENGDAAHEAPQEADTTDNAPRDATHNVVHSAARNAANNEPHGVANNAHNAPHDVAHNADNAPHDVAHNAHNAPHDVAHNADNAPHNENHNVIRVTADGATREPQTSEPSTSTTSIQNPTTAQAGPPLQPLPAPSPPAPPARRKSRSGSAETIDDIAAMIASSQRDPPPLPPPPETDPTVTIDKLESVLASPKRDPQPSPPQTIPQTKIPQIKLVEKIIEPVESSAVSDQSKGGDTKVDSDKKDEEKEEKPMEHSKEGDKEIPAEVAEAAAAPRRRSAVGAAGAHAGAPNVPVESPSEAKPAEPELSSAPPPAQPAAASFVEVENQLERMFAGIEERPAQPRKHSTNRRKSAPAAGNRKQRRLSRGGVRGAVRGGRAKCRRGPPSRSHDQADSASNASSTKSKGPYIQIKGPCASPVSVSVMNASAASAASEDEEAWRRRSGRGARRRGLHASTLGLRYDAVTPDATWLCCFCHRGPHAPPALGDLFGPYHLDNDCEEYRALDEATRRKYESSGDEVWFHEECAVWAPGVVAAGARVWGLAPAVWGARQHRCPACGRPAAPLACHARHCRARAHLPCAKTNGWTLNEDEFRAFCPRHA